MIHMVLIGLMKISELIGPIMRQCVTKADGYVVKVIEDWATFERLLS